MSKEEKLRVQWKNELAEAAGKGKLVRGQNGLFDFKHMQDPGSPYLAEKEDGGE